MRLTPFERQGAIWCGVLAIYAFYPIHWLPRHWLFAAFAAFSAYAIPTLRRTDLKIPERLGGLGFLGFLGCLGFLPGLEVLHLLFALGGFFGFFGFTLRHYRKEKYDNE